MKKLRIAACVPKMVLGDTESCAAEVIRLLELAARQNADLAVFPELCLTGATCGDLFLFEHTVAAAAAALDKVREATKKLKIAAVVGLPECRDGKVYNTCAVLSGGALLAKVQKTDLSAGERRQFAPGARTKMPTVCGVPLCIDFGAGSGTEFCVRLDPSAVPYAVYEAQNRRNATRARSADCGIALAVNAGYGESTTDGVYSGHVTMCAAGKEVACSAPFAYDACTVADFDIDDIKSRLPQKVEPDNAAFERRHPFVPTSEKEKETILQAVSTALAARLTHTHSSRAVLGLSGGLDSTLALLVCMRALDRLGFSRDRLLAISMPCFGTSDVTKSAAARLSALAGADARVIGIGDSVTRHLTEIGHDFAPDTAFENAQARMRTMVLFDVANRENGLAVGTGDLSEEALGWCTYNGDHMAAYNVNASVPKTLVKALVSYEAARLGGDWKEALRGVLETDISPELLPPKDGRIAQKTEEILGPYEYNDFFLYHAVFGKVAPEKVTAAAAEVFGGEPADYDLPLRRFYARFFAAQFKRSCAPDGVGIGYSLSPRGGLCLPSDLKIKSF